MLKHIAKIGHKLAKLDIHASSKKLLDGSCDQITKQCTSEVIEDLPDVLKAICKKEQQSGPQSQQVGKRGHSLYKYSRQNSASLHKGFYGLLSSTRTVNMPIRFSRIKPSCALDNSTNNNLGTFKNNADYMDRIINSTPTSLTPNLLSSGALAHGRLCPSRGVCLQTFSVRQFHAAGSKVHYLDFRHRFATNHLRLHLLIIRRQKMKKHRRRKFRRKFKCLLAKQRLKREIAKEKAFRVELLSAIRAAENFDPKEYALRKIAEENNKAREPTREERLESLKELIRKNRYQTTYIKPKHIRAET